jgi:general nucleoside transport system permease protein
MVFQGIVFLSVLYSESLYGKLPIFKERPPTVRPTTAATPV